MNTERILLNLHLVTQVRLAAAKLPFGVSRTKWINDAICQRLDRDCPDTIGLSPDPFFIAKRAKAAKGPYLLKHRNRWFYKAAKREHNRLMATVGESPGLETLIERLCIKHGEEMSQKEKDMYVEGAEIPSTMASEEDREKAVEAIQIRAIEMALDVNPPPLANVAPMVKVPEVSETGELSDTAEYLELCKPVKTAKLAEDEEEDFWGDESLAKIRANVRKHNS